MLRNTNEKERQQAVQQGLPVIETQKDVRLPVGVPSLLCELWQDIQSGKKVWKPLLHSFDTTVRIEL